MSAPINTEFTDQQTMQETKQITEKEETYETKLAQHATSVEQLSIAAFAPNTLLGKLLKMLSPLLDRLIGINKVRDIYQQAGLSGLPKQQFSAALLNALNINIHGINSLIQKIPKQGKCIVVANHPFGMIEGVILAKALADHRSDTKVMANAALQVFKEISDYFIFADPIRPSHVKNTSALKQCFAHVEAGGLLLIFPAGKVSTYHSELQRIADAPWNRIAVNIAKKTQCPVLPIHISGQNSQLFHLMGRVYFRLRLLMLTREMFKLRGKKVTLTAGNLINAQQLNTFTTGEHMNDYLRLQTYLNDPNYFSSWPEDTNNTVFKEILAPTPGQEMLAELNNLPEKQQLLSFKNFTVYYGYQSQLPQCVREITRLREITFRTLNEGSGEPCDSDQFDASYLHLFIFDHKENEIIGAYRMGQSDVLTKAGSTGLYLAHMFNFEANFVNQQQPCLEMGRSFIVEKHQASYHGLLLLWKGIGAYVCQNPHYRTLYGTVSLSKLYDPRSVALIDRVLVNKREGVSANCPFIPKISPEVNDYLAKHSPDIEQLSAIVQGIEQDGKDLPILVKQYHKLGANFHCIGIDKSFNHTPGLLLSVDLPSAPEKLLKLYLGKGKEQYLNYLN